MTHFPTLCHGLQARCDSNVRVRFIDNTDTVREVSIAELRARALGLLHHFVARDIRPGDELILCTENNLAFLDAFWACQLGGITAVPVAPGASEQQRGKLFKIYGQLRRPFVFTDLNTGARIRALADKLGIHQQYRELKSRTVLSDHIDDLGRSAETVARNPEETAFIQFSSGSTGDPKGVVLSHENLCVNIQDIQNATGLHPEDRSLSWMPLTHDMGLIGFHLTMLMAGVTHCIMATNLFIRRPTLWLQLAQREGATFLCSPNFGYRLFLKAFDRWKIDDLDLSRIRFILNGAEPISAAVCREFIEKLSPFGLSPTAMVPGYGLAEASLAVSFGNSEKGLRSINLRPGQPRAWTDGRTRDRREQHRGGGSRLSRPALQSQNQR